jgi:hypothetical protein
VKLIAGNFLGLGPISGLEVDDRYLASIQAPDKVDTAVDGDARRDVDLNRLFGKFRVPYSLPCVSK